VTAPARIAVCLLALATAPAARGQATATSTTESTSVSRQVKGGVVQAVAGNKVVLREADGLHEYTLPDGFKFDVNGQPVGVDQVQPGMTVGAMITDRVTTRQVRETRVASATVMQVAPGGIVVKTADGNLKSYDFKDAAGNDIYFVRDGKQVSLRDVKKGERLSGTFITTLPPQEITQRSAVASAAAPEPAPAAVAVATPRRLPRTASPLPILGLFALVSAGVALALRGVRALR
jgi:hypothetical protein